jgi:PRC-barrel domain
VGRRGGRCALFEAEDIRDWRGHAVVDLLGSKIGSLEAVYFDTATEQPTFATVKVGIVGRHRLVFVPLFEARVSPGHVRVTADKKLVKDAPAIDTDGELTAAQEPAVFEHYGLRYEPGTSGERRLGRR